MSKTLGFIEAYGGDEELIEQALWKMEDRSGPWHVWLVIDGKLNRWSFDSNPEAWTFYYETCKQAPLGGKVTIARKHIIQASMEPQRVSKDSALSIFSGTLYRLAREMGLEPPRDPLDPSWGYFIRKHFSPRDGSPGELSKGMV